MATVPRTPARTDDRLRTRDNALPPAILGDSPALLHLQPAARRPGLVQARKRHRHAYGRQCVDLGVDIRVIAEALGHESLESTKIYT